jgi:glycosyltransferase involved in cell wall biosynthesis
MVSEHASPLSLLGGVDAGGQNVHVADLARAIARRGVDVVVHTRRDDADLPADVRFAGNVHVHHIDAGPPEPVPKDELLPHMGEFACELRRLWRATPPAAVHSHFWMSGLASLEAARPLGIPVLHTYHALGIVKRRNQGGKDTSPPGRLDAEALIAREADRIVATSNEERHELITMGGDPSRISVVPCGVDLDRFRPDGAVEPRPRQRPRVVVVSRLVERKGIGNVIEALAMLDDVDLVIAGGPPRDALAEDEAVQRYRRLAERLGVADRVELRGAVARDEVPALLRSADAVACCPWYEPFGLVAVEAMACGVPVVASNVGGLAETVVDGRTGLHVPPRSPAAIAEALRRLLADDSRRRSMARAAARRAERYGWDRVAASTMAAVDEVRAIELQRRSA